MECSQPVVWPESASQWVRPPSAQATETKDCKQQSNSKLPLDPSHAVLELYSFRISCKSTFNLFWEIHGTGNRPELSNCSLRPHISRRHWQKTISEHEVFLSES